MQVNEVLRFVISSCDLSYRQVSATLGKSPNWAGIVSMPSRTPSTATLADVADVCGYDLQLVRRDTGATVTVTPPRRAGDGA